MTVRAHSAIIDIGSNSIRLVIYNGPKRAPSVMFNEKVLAGLGAGLAETGALAQPTMARALAALRRYKLLIDQAGVECVRVVATAAVREARNGDSFVNEIKALGFNVDVLSGDEEARAAGYGVISAFPEVDGIVGDLGGGSLELIRVKGGEPQERISLPLGSLRLRPIREKGEEGFRQHIDQYLRDAGWDKIKAGLPFYLVGGSWRTLARFHMRLSDYPLAVLHHYTMNSNATEGILQKLDEMGPQRAKAIAGLSAARTPTLSDSALLLGHLAKTFKSAQLIVSSYGLREGLLYEALALDERREDPLIAATRYEGQRQGRFTEHGDLLAQWTAGLFIGETAEDARLRHAACLLSDVSWRAHPDFRAERGLDAALHGNWVGIDGRGRAMLAQALFYSFGGSPAPTALLLRLTSADDLARAMQWGLAIRLGQRLSGGLAAPLQNSGLELSAESVTLRLSSDLQSLLGDVVERRHRQLAAAFGRTPQSIIQ